MTIYSYDANGNLTSKATGTSVVRYYWDEEDKMVRLEDSVVMNFKTDGLGFRRYKEVVRQSVTYFVYDLAASETPGLVPLIAEYDGNGNLVAKYHHDGGLIAMTRGNQSYWYVFEAIGSVRQLTDTQSQVPDAYFYDAWGNELTSPYSQVSNPFRYVGKHGYYLDTQSALMLLGVRYYENWVGRFVSLDPILEVINRYLYVKHNPVIYFDPSGLDAVAGTTTITIIWVWVMAEPTGALKICAIGVVIVAGIVVGVVAVCKVCRHVLCKQRHPTWMICPPNATSDPVTATWLKAESDIDPSKCQAFVTECKPRGAALNCPGGAPGVRYYCDVAFVNRQFKVVFRRYSVNCCACCYTFREGTSCLALHLSGNQTLPPECLK